MTTYGTADGRFRRTAERLIGDAIARVVYVGLSGYEDPDSIAWDFGDWHWPEVGVELTMLSGVACHAIWDSTDAHFQLALVEGPMSDSWLPLQATPSTARAWDVTEHARWRPLVGRPINGFGVTLNAPDDTPIEVPVALKLDVDSAGVWIIAASLCDWQRTPADLGREDIYLGSDEVLVAFSPERAAALGL